MWVEVLMPATPSSPSTWLGFADMFPDETSCEQWLAEWRWPDGFRCPACDGQDAYRLASRPLWQGCSCRRQTSLTAGTALHRTKLPLRIWLYALWLIAIRKVSISALQLQRETGLGSYKTAWLLLHKVRATLEESPDYYPMAASISDAPGVFAVSRVIGDVNATPGATWVTGQISVTGLTHPSFLDLELGELGGTVEYLFGATGGSGPVEGLFCQEMQEDCE